jgi:hypothetical protein
LLLLYSPGIRVQMDAWPGGPNYGKPPKPKGEADRPTEPTLRPLEARPSEWWKQWDG